MTNLYLAATKNHTLAILTLAHRYDNGINVEHSCEAASIYYEIAARESVQHYKDHYGYFTLFDIELPVDLINPTKMKDQNVMTKEFFDYHKLNA